jgi:uroporphyrinogen decarboxylase
MNKRDQLLDLVHSGTAKGPIPAAFFLHFDPAYHPSRAAVQKHLEFFRFTGMDLVKVQYEQKVPTIMPPRRPEDWAGLPAVDEAFCTPTLETVRGLVEAAGQEALVLLTVYSPFMWARHFAGDETLSAHLREKPEAVARGLEIAVENVRTLVRAAIRLGVDGFYTSTQGGESFRFDGTDLFERWIKPTDLAVWDTISGCRFNILHVCDYEGGYSDLSPYLDYPGHVVNSFLQVGGRALTPREISGLFGRPFMGGLERKGILATGTPDEVRREVGRVLAESSEIAILAADCTVPSGTPWENLRAAVDAAHSFSR